MSRVTVSEYSFDVNDEIGRGSSGIVYIGHHQSTQERVAIKRVDLGSIHIKIDKLWNESQIMKKLSHPNVIGLLYVNLDYSREYMDFVMEYCDGVENCDGTARIYDLADYIDNYSLDMNQVYHFMVQIKDGLKYLRSQGIVHRDLKPHNLLLHQDVIKIADFGLSVSSSYDDKKLMNTICGSPLYMSPEIIAHKDYNTKSDLWSIGIIMYQLIFAIHPYQGCRNMDDLTRMVSTTKPITYPSNPPVDTLTMDLLQSLLNKNCHDRISWDEFFDHPWFKHPPHQALTDDTQQAIFSGENSLDESAYEQILKEPNEEIFQFSDDESDKLISQSMQTKTVTPSFFQPSRTNFNLKKPIYSKDSITNKSTILPSTTKSLTTKSIRSSKSKKISSSPGFSLSQYVVKDYKKAPPLGYGGGGGGGGGYGGYGGRRRKRGPPPLNRNYQTVDERINTKLIPTSQVRQVYGTAGPILGGVIGRPRPVISPRNNNHPKQNKNPTDHRNQVVDNNALNDNALNDNALSDNALNDNALNDNALSDNELNDNELSNNNGGLIGYINRSIAWLKTNLDW